MQLNSNYALAQDEAWPYEKNKLPELRMQNKRCMGALYICEPGESACIILRRFSGYIFIKWILNAVRKSYMGFSIIISFGVFSCAAYNYLCTLLFCANGE